MKLIQRIFSQAWRKANQFKIMVIALVFLLVVPFLLYHSMQNGNTFFIWFDLGLIGIGMLLIILAA